MLRELNDEQIWMYLAFSWMADYCWNTRSPKYPTKMSFQREYRSTMIWSLLWSPTGARKESCYKRTFVLVIEASYIAILPKA